jgi:hypothetical protein
MYYILLYNTTICELILAAEAASERDREHNIYAFIITDTARAKGDT